MDAILEQHRRQKEQCEIAWQVFKIFGIIALLLIIVILNDKGVITCL